MAGIDLKTRQKKRTKCGDKDGKEWESRLQMERLPLQEIPNLLDFVLLQNFKNPDFIHSMDTKHTRVLLLCFLALYKLLQSNFQIISLPHIQHDRPRENGPQLIYMWCI